MLIPTTPTRLSAQETARAQTLKLTPNKLDFGLTPVGTKTQPQTVTLTNTGTSALNLASILVSGIDFTQTNNCRENLPAGAQCTIQITFQPVISGDRLGTAIITAADPASPHLLVLNGTGQ